MHSPQESIAISKIVVDNERVAEEVEACDKDSDDFQVERPNFFPGQYGVFVKADKEHAAQKRQKQRDDRRKSTNPKRMTEKEQRERERKDRQWRNSGRKDPYYDDECGEPSEYGRSRSQTRRGRCKRTGRDCDDDSSDDDAADAAEDKKQR